MVMSDRVSTVALDERLKIKLSGELRITRSSTDPDLVLVTLYDPEANEPVFEFGPVSFAEGYTIHLGPIDIDISMVTL